MKLFRFFRPHPFRRRALTKRLEPYEARHTPKIIDLREHRPTRLEARR